MPQPLVSIVIPCFNADGYVAEAIESALAQVYPHKEVIVIDDGSTDCSLNVIRSFGDRIRWETGPRRGGCAARNRGLEIAQGELIQFLDSDDILYPHKLERQVAARIEYGADVTFCNWDFGSAGADSRAGTCRPVYDGGDAVVFVLRKQLQTAAPLHARSMLRAVGGFRVGLPCAQERDLHLRLACSGATFHYIPETLYVVRKVQGSVSSDSVRVLEQHLDMVRRGLDILSSCGTLNDSRSRHLAGLLAADARRLLRHGRCERAEEYFREARKIHPSGGLEWAYKGKSRYMRWFLGAALTERLARWKQGRP